MEHLHFLLGWTRTAPGGRGRGVDYSVSASSGSGGSNGGSAATRGIIPAVPEPRSPPMPERNDPYVSLRNRNFLWFVASLVAFTFGTQIQATVVAWQVYALTKDPLSLGLVGLAEALPFIGAALYAGHVADRHNRKRLSLLAIGVQTLAALRPARLHAAAGGAGGRAGLADLRGGFPQRRGAQFPATGPHRAERRDRAPRDLRQRDRLARVALGARRRGGSGDGRPALRLLRRPRRPTSRRRRSAWPA